MLDNIQETLGVVSEEPPRVPVIRRSQEFWCKSSIASLSALQISRLSDRSLVELVEIVQHYLPHALVRGRLLRCDRLTLERLAFVARRVCRNQGY